ncbi:MAG: restriction endonuclease subunit S [Lachnospiraceae bacterium]|nr:restriction endonuclease subunit S [Lachnospiraceae bacterium]
MCSIVTKQTGFDYTATIKKSLVTEASEDTLPYLQTKNFAGVSISYDTDYFIPKSVAKEFPKINLDEKCILFSIVGASVGNIGLFPGDKHCFLSGAICVSKLNNHDDADYLYHYMCSENGQGQIRTCTKGGAQATITIEDIREFDVLLPSEQERAKIGELLSLLDNLITLHQRKLN